jgi:predicted TPR repeat methyltransferase
MRQALHETKVFSSSGDLLADRRYEMARGYRGDGDLAAAIDLLEQVVELQPGFAAAWFDLGDAREVMGQREDAVAAFQEALKADPADRHGAGLRLRLLDIGGHAMSADYVRSVFDQYARKFDDALAALSYSAPQMLAQAVEAVCGERQRPMQFGTMLDLGCGTGLSGEAFRPMVDWMDERARADARFNLIVAADVFVYCADLTLIANMAAEVLAYDGLFAFTVETHPNEGVMLGPKLRYAHGEKHVRDAVSSAGMMVLRLASVSTRMEADRPVPGLLVIAGLSPSSPLSSVRSQA